VPPDFTIANVDYSHWAYPKKPPYSVQGQFVLFNQLPNTDDVSRAQFGLVVGGSQKNKLSTLGNHVALVVLCSTNKKMVWVATLGVVAVVADEQSFGYGATRNLPRKPVCSAMATLKCGSPVAQTGKRFKLPYPALVRIQDSYIAPKIASSRAKDLIDDSRLKRFPASTAAFYKSSFFHETDFNLFVLSSQGR
jgi:hypothetical protein